MGGQAAHGTHSVISGLFQQACWEFIMVAKAPEYLVSHGKTSVLGRFVAASLDPLRRGERVVLQSVRGLSVGTVLSEATERQARVLGSEIIGQIVRRLSAEDRKAHAALRQREHQLFDAARNLVARLSLPMEILDVEIALDGRRAILQYLLAGECEPTALLDALAAEHQIEVWLENLAAPAEPEQAGCGKPDCGKKEGGCSSCGSGGCSSCGTGPVDLKPYFSHLRDKMDDKRTPLL